VEQEERSAAAGIGQPSARRLLYGGICWIAALEFFVAQAIAQAAWKGSHYSLVSNAISDLGVTACGKITIEGQAGYYCSPLHNVMNASFVVTGVLMLLGLYLTRPVWPGSRPTRWAFALFTLAGIGKIIVGLAPGNVNYGLHSLGSLGMILGNIAVILFGLAVSATNDRWIRRISLALGIIGIIGAVFFVGHRALGGAGAAERVADYPVFAWMFVVGIRSVRWPRRPQSLPTAGLRPGTSPASGRPSGRR